jgi:hypothetical protein
MQTNIAFPAHIERLAGVRTEREIRDAKQKYLLAELKRVNGIIESECLPEVIPFLRQYKQNLNAALGTLK